jgi:hypothetical protein
MRRARLYTAKASVLIRLFGLSSLRLASILVAPFLVPGFYLPTAVLTFQSKRDWRSMVFTSMISCAARVSSRMASYLTKSVTGRRTKVCSEGRSNCVLSIRNSIVFRQALVHGNQVKSVCRRHERARAVKGSRRAPSLTSGYEEPQIVLLDDPVSFSWTCA